MKSRFFYVTHRGTDLSATLAEEGVVSAVSSDVIETGNEHVAMLPRVAEKLNDIETLYYAGASEALSAALDDLERYIKLLAVGSYKDITLNAMESASLSEVNAAYSTIVNYSLRLIENIHTDEADEVRGCLEGYLEMFESCTFEPGHIQKAFTNIEAVLESVLNGALEKAYAESGFDIDENAEVVGMESVIKQAMSEIGSEEEFEALPTILNDMIEDLYINACEQLIVTEGSKHTAFDRAMEAPLDSSYFQDRNKADKEKEEIANAKTEAKNAKSAAEKYLKELRSLSRDIDIGRSRNNNSVLSSRNNKKLEKIRAGKHLDGAIDQMEEFIERAKSLDPKDPNERSEIFSLSGKIDALYNNASKMGKDALDEENEFVENARRKQVEKAKTEGIKEKALNKISKSALGLKNKLAKARDDKYKKDMHDIEDAYRAGKISKEERDAKLAAREKKFVDKKKDNFIDRSIDKARGSIKTATDKMKADRDEIVKNDGVYHRDKDLVEKDIQEAFKEKPEKKAPVKKTVKEKPAKDSKPANDDEKDSEKSTTFEDPNTASRAKNFKAFTPAAKRQLQEFKNDYKKLYDDFQNLKETDPNYETMKSKTKAALDKLKSTVNGLDAAFEKKASSDVESSKKTDDGKPAKEPKKGTVKITDKMSPEDKKEYNALRRDMTESSQAVREYEELCQLKNQTPSPQRLNSLKKKNKECIDKFNAFKAKFEGEATEAVAGLLYEDINLVQYAIESGFSIYDMATMDDDAFESFMSDIADIAYDDCVLVATAAIEGRETREEKKARKEAKRQEAEAKKREKEEKIKEERSNARQKVINYANNKIKQIDKLQKTIGAKWHTYSNDVKNLADRGTDGKLRGLKNLRERRIVRQSVGGAKFDFNKYNQLLADLKATKKSLNDFISSKRFYDEYDSTNTPEEDYKEAVREINKMVNKLIKNATESETQIEKLGKVLDNNKTVLHERDDKEAWRKKQAEDATKKDKKNNPDKYLLRESDKVHKDYVTQKAELEAKQASEKATIVGPGKEAMELPEVVDSIEDFDYSIDCMLFDLRDTLVDPEIFFESSNAYAE